MSGHLSVAKNFLCIGVQHWGQRDDARAKATERYLLEAGFDVSVSPAPASKIIDAIKGKDGVGARIWLQEVLLSMPRGKFEDEADHLSKAVDAIIRLRETAA